MSVNCTKCMDKGKYTHQPAVEGGGFGRKRTKFCSCKAGQKARKVAQKSAGGDGENPSDSAD